MSELEFVCHLSRYHFDGASVVLRFSSFGFNQEKAKPVLQVEITRPRFGLDAIEALSDEEIGDFQFDEQQVRLVVYPDETPLLLDGDRVQSEWVAYDLEDWRAYARSLWDTIDRQSASQRELRQRVHEVDIFIGQRIDVLQRKAASRPAQADQFIEQSKQLLPILRKLRGE